MSKDQKAEPITIREKFCIKMLLFIVKILHPYSWEHDFSEIYKSINADLK